MSHTPCGVESCKASWQLDVWICAASVFGEKGATFSMAFGAILSSHVCILHPSGGSAQQPRDRTGFCSGKRLVLGAKWVHVGKEQEGGVMS